ncbi:MAG TPA: peptide-methionine (S)-S-oxide reductase MsrA, partial [Gemmatimonadaceae bacterium]
MWKAFSGMAVLAAGLVAAAPVSSSARELSVPPVKSEQTIVLAGGCFWGVQSVFEHTKGVTSAVSGYAGGSVDSPSYELVSTGRTGHAESVKVTFDTTQISLNQILQIFFSVAHDPTELNHQGPDVGTQYRSMIDYTSDAQKAQVTSYIAQLEKAHTYSKPIVTQVVAYKNFFPAEAYHQHYAELHPTQPYIAMYDLPKVAN